MPSVLETPALHLRRRRFLAGLAGAAMVRTAAPRAAAPLRIGFANANETAGVRLEGLGFTGPDVRRSFELAARTLPVQMIYYDNAGDTDSTLKNADDAINRRLDLLIEYSADTSANAEIARRLRAANIPVLAINYPVGDAPLYTADNYAAGTIAGHALGEFASQTWQEPSPLAVVIGDLGDPADAVSLRLKGITDGLHAAFPTVAANSLDTGGQPLRAEGVLAKFLAAQPQRKVLIAALDDPTALSARTAVEVSRRQSDCIIISQGLDRSIHGGASEKKEIDPANRGSVVLGSVAYFLDRYGYEILPIAMRMLNGEKVPARTVTRHVLVTGSTVFREYPPTDMN